jgi:hypothetical protein
MSAPSIYERAAAILLRQMSSIVFKALTKSGSFDDYEQIIGIESPHADFRRRLSVEIARYIDGAWMQATCPTGDLGQKVKAARHKLKISRNRLNKRALTGSPDHDKAFYEWLYHKVEFDDHKLPRGRAKNEFAAFFVQRTAEIYAAITGREAVIDNRDNDNGGPFGEFLQAITDDTHGIANALRLDRKHLSTSLARQARYLRKH